MLTAIESPPTWKSVVSIVSRSGVYPPQGPVLSSSSLSSPTGEGYVNSKWPRTTLQVRASVAAKTEVRRAMVLILMLLLPI